MITKPLDVLQQFPIRKNKKQKQAFRDAVQSYAAAFGYTCEVEKGSLGARNVIIGNPERAKYLITAHYDTPACMIIPNLITPCNFWTFLGYQLVLVAVIYCAAFVPGLILRFLGIFTEFNPMIWALSVYAVIGLMLLGPANKSNANDNTSGVTTVLVTAATLPEQFRGQVCFILFDLEEAGLIGSYSYAKKHKKEIRNQIVLNCDCVGDGDELVMFPTSKVKKNRERMESLRSICGKVGGKSLALREKGFAFSPSDQRNFPFGVGIAAFRRSRWAGLYCSKIHTKKDTVLDEHNVSFLRDRLIAFIRSAAQ